MRALFFVLPIFWILSGCSEGIQAQDQSPTTPDEITATERPSVDGKTETPDIEFRDPVRLD